MSWHRSSLSPIFSNGSIGNQKDSVTVFREEESIFPRQLDPESGILGSGVLAMERGTELSI
jgi:hypothetical protein